MVATCAQAVTDADTAKVVAAAQVAVKKSLRDPDSARFRGGAVATADLDNGKSNRVVCGYVNSKNGFGGYSGEQIWYVYRLWEGTGGVCVNKIEECPYTILAAKEAVKACKDGLGP